MHIYQRYAAPLNRKTRALSATAAATFHKTITIIMAGQDFDAAEM